MSFDWTNFKILVADDDQTLLDVECDILKSMGATVFAATDGQMALEIVKSLNIHIVISDIQMPKATGIEFLYEIRRLDAGKPIVLFASGQSAINAEKAMELGAIGLLVKPFKIKDMLNVVQQALQKAYPSGVPGV